MFLIKPLTAVLFWLTLTTTVFALETDKSSPILIEANQVDMAEKTGISTYTGNVTLKQGSIKISADSIVVYTKDKKLQRIIATGNPAYFSQQPDHSSEPVQASARHVEYVATTGMLVLQDDAQMQQGANSFSSNKIEYDTANDILSASAAEKGKHRVKAVIQPDTFQTKEKP